MKKTNSEYKWVIGMIKTRYNLGLSTEQAEKIHEYEQLKDFPSSSFGPYFTFWEEMDFEMSCFEKILDTQQLEIYKQYKNKEIKFHEENLIEQDKKHLKQIDYHNEYLKYHLNEFLPALYEDITLRMFTTISGETAKVNYLKECYSEFLNTTRKEIVISHFRSYRNFSPNQLESSLLSQSCLYVWPDYLHFKHKADEITKAIIEHLKTKLKYLTPLNSQINKALEQFQEHNQATFEKYYGKPDGSTFIVRSTEEEDKVSLAFSLLLLDEDSYGYKKD